MKRSIKNIHAKYRHLIHNDGNHHCKRSPVSRIQPALRYELIVFSLNYLSQKDHKESNKVAHSSAETCRNTIITDNIRLLYIYVQWTCFKLSKQEHCCTDMNVLEKKNARSKHKSIAPSPGTVHRLLKHPWLHHLNFHTWSTYPETLDEPTLATKTRLKCTQTTAIQTCAETIVHLHVCTQP